MDQIIKKDLKRILYRAIMLTPNDEVTNEEIQILLSLAKEAAVKRRLKMAKGTPKKDGSGGGNRSNRGRGGCKTTKPKGKGK